MHDDEEEVKPFINEDLKKMFTYILNDFDKRLRNQY